MPRDSIARVLCLNLHVLEDTSLNVCMAHGPHALEMVAHGAVPVVLEGHIHNGIRCSWWQNGALDTIMLLALSRDADVQPRLPGT